VWIAVTMIRHPPHLATNATGDAALTAQCAVALVT
jgi:hypothetical protein